MYFGLAGADVHDYFIMSLLLENSCARVDGSGGTGSCGSRYAIPGMAYGAAC